MVEINQNNVSVFFDYLGFSLKDGEESTYYKNYKKCKNYEIKIILDKNDFKKSKIDYGDKITVSRGTTANFSQQENFVILECVDRLLEKGYAPDRIILEKDWRLGHKEKGCLDIQVLDENNNSFLMIECKTWDKEYKKEKNKMYDDGGQLFSYFVQDRDTKYLCLYASVISDDKFIFENSIVKITEEIAKSTTQKDAFENWKPQIFENKGIFEDEIKPYNIKFSGLRKRDLKDLSREDGGDIFNRFAEILRRNVVSDKTNAYNKIFNLFLCKIVDEYEKDEDSAKLEFQWEEGESNEIVLLRLNDLYKRGMMDYLSLDISAVTITQLEQELENIKTKKDKEKIKNLFIEQKLYTSNDFAFKEVFDKKTFDLNCLVVKEVVKLLEPYKIRYETKQQFLGDFFEKLLNTGIKQEVGQFFTPVPIAQFICKSLPVFEIIQSKNNEREINFLPYVIDYASGSGHFLTEMMEEINHYVEKIDNNFIRGGARAKIEFNSLKQNMLWAKEYIYGIEKDYRLAKTTKISTFLNGDGDATVICGDGLDNFSKSDDYKGRLKIIKHGKQNEQFDIVVANPPYSVSGFKTTVKNGNESFDLFDEFTDKSKEIECLFIERTKQLLKIGGVAGIILPSSILANKGIYEKIRELILDNFEIKGIVELGTNTFMATGTNTIILFLKRVENEKEKIINLIKESVKQKKDLTIKGIDKPIQKYLEQNYKIDFNKYISSFDESKELNKLLYFVLSYNKKVVISNTPKKIEEERDFLGYYFSNRRGYEGIDIFNLGGKLYNPENNEDDTKVNSYILKNFKEEPLEVNGNVPTIKILNLNEMIDFEADEFRKTININKKKQINFKEGIELEPLVNRINVVIGGTPSRRVRSYFGGKNLWVSIQQMDGTEILDTKEKITDEAVKNSNVKLIKKGTTLLSFKLSIGKTAIAGKDLYTNEAIAGLEIKSEFRKNVLDKYLFFFFSSNLAKSLLERGNNVFGSSLNKPFIENIKMPFPKLEIQQKIVSESEKLQKKESENKEGIVKLQTEVRKIIDSLKGKNDVRIGNICITSSGGTPLTSKMEYYKDGTINWLTSGEVRNGLIRETKYKITELGLKNSSAKIFPINTVLVAMYGATAGQVGILGIESSTNQAICGIMPNEKINPKYLYYYLRQQTSDFLDIRTGVARPNLSQDKIKNFKIPVLPISVQENVVKEIEQIENKINALEEENKGIEAKKDEIIKSCLF